jgi:hypothetical protein
MTNDTEIQSIWPCRPEAEALLLQIYNDYCTANPQAASMAQRMLDVAGVLLHNLIDHWMLPEGYISEETLLQAAFERAATPDGDPYWHAAGTTLPPIRFAPAAELSSPRMAIRVESISDFAEAWDFPETGRLGDTDSGYEEARHRLQAGELALVVRIGYSGYRPGELSASDLRTLLQVRERLRARDRSGDTLTAIARCYKLLGQTLEQIGQDRTTDEFFAAERDFYVSRCHAARVQLKLQNEIGIGWANQDHHTYRSSREGFRALMRIWSLLGFRHRERYYAGAEAGWGAQIVEHAASRVVIFSDVDIAPDELDINFAEELLPPRQELSTIGLWCGLHGDSIAAAGMHHLECEYDFNAATNALQREGVGMMKPFTNLNVLKQAFTNAEVWHPEPARVQALRSQGSITEEQAELFLQKGAPGSHLEILQRRQGFKGFNKTGVSEIIRATDARTREQ